MKCPNCSLIRTIDNENIDPKHKTRCSKKLNGCGITYYSLKNIVPKIEQKPQKTEQNQNNLEQFNKSMKVATRRLTEYKTTVDMKNEKKDQLKEYILACNAGHQSYKKYGFKNNHQFLAKIMGMVDELR